MTIDLKTVATDWTEAADSLCTAVEKRIEATARKAAESLYEGLLYDTQDYLRENALYNLKQELESARAAEGRAREALNRIAEAVGSGVQNYYEETANRAITVVEVRFAAAREHDALREQIAVHERTIARQHRQSGTSRTFWVRAAKAALAGDMRELRNRVDLAEAPPVDVVLSEALNTGDQS